MDRIQAIVEVYTTTVDKFISDSKMPRLKAYEALMARSNKSRVAKIADFQLKDSKGKVVGKVSDLYSTEDIYSITNMVYYRFKEHLTPQAEGAIVADDILAIIKAK